MAEAAVRAVMLTFFLSHGYPEFQARAFIDSSKIESGLDACANGGADGMYLAQWVGPRRRRLEEAWGWSGCPPIWLQLEFASMELRATPAYSCFLNTKNYAQAFRAIRRGFEGGSCGR